MSTSFKNVTPAGPGGTATLLIVLSFTGFLLLTQSLFVVPSGQVAVVTTLGKVSGPSRRAGLNFKLPFIQSVYPFDIKTQVQPEKFETLTKDLKLLGRQLLSNIQSNLMKLEEFSQQSQAEIVMFIKKLFSLLYSRLSNQFFTIELETIATELQLFQKKWDTVAQN